VANRDTMRAASVFPLRVVDPYLHDSGFVTGSILGAETE
jgi:hypothetical protein